MICPHCGSEEFRVVDVYRNTVIREGKRTGSEKDTRLIMCRECMKTYYTETEIIAEVSFNTEKLRQMLIPYEELK